MKTTKASLLISIFAFFFGCLTVWLIDWLPVTEKPRVVLPILESDFQTTTPVEPIKIVIPDSPPRFTATYTACGFTSSTQGYITNDGQGLSQSSIFFSTTKKDRAELKNKIKKAVHMVEHNLNYTGIGKVVGERIVIINPTDKDGRKTVSILWYEGGQFIESIDASSVDLALEFEAEQKLLAEKELKN